MGIEESVESAERLFRAGSFAEARRICGTLLSGNPGNHRILTMMGYTALLANRLEDAEKWLSKSIEFNPREARLESLLAEVYYRRDEFRRAVPLLENVGRKAMARKLESFKDITPYQLEGIAESTDLRFVMAEPLPVVQVRVNNSKPVNFFIDTGGAEIIIDTEFATEIGEAKFGSEKGYAAGGELSYQHGRIDSLEVGDLTVKHVPTHIVDVRRFSQPVFGGTRVDGVIGTVFLYHFIATIDYPGFRLVLRRRTKENLGRAEQEAVKEKSAVVPFWMAPDHYMVAEGSVNNSQKMLFLVDTGLAGNGFTCPESTIQEAGIKLQEDEASEGIGGGEKRVTSIPFVVNRLTLGAAIEHDIRGLYMKGFFPIDKQTGFRVGGLISHEFFKHYALTLDFDGMRYFLKRRSSD